MIRRVLSSMALSLIALATTAMVPASAGSSMPVNFVNLNFAPITTSISSNYDWSTGSLTPGTATASVFSTANAVQNTVSDPPHPTPNGYGTFIGTAEPIRDPSGGGAVLYESSVCQEATQIVPGVPECLVDGTLTYGDMVLYDMRGASLDELTNLQSQYYVKSGCFGGGSPRFSIVMSNGAEIHVYFGTYPAFNDCPPPDTWIPTSNYATDAAGLRWDDSQLPCGAFYQTYSMAVTCADALGLSINAIVVATDGGWSPPNAGTPDGQTFLFRDIQTNQVTRFPRK